MLDLLSKVVTDVSSQSGGDAVRVVGVPVAELPVGRTRMQEEKYLGCFGIIFHPDIQISGVDTHSAGMEKDVLTNPMRTTKRSNGLNHDPHRRRRRRDDWARTRSVATASGGEGGGDHENGERVSHVLLQPRLAVKTLLHLKFRKGKKEIVKGRKLLLKLLA
ncbi:MAG: hypothetical protein Q8P35_00630 [Candidatus Yanofskybacteria bacterium]|nr:hypothetical protein [Candidatus Yanofskybacteria bacterium]